MLDAVTGEDGDAAVVAAERDTHRNRTTAETSAYLSAVGACALELDEGNKYAAGHAAAHVGYGYSGVGPRRRPCNPRVRCGIAAPSQWAGGYLHVEAPTRANVEVESLGVQRCLNGRVAA